jgi:hypothetical protein
MMVGFRGRPGGPHALPQTSEDAMPNYRHIRTAELQTAWLAIVIAV